MMHDKYATGFTVFISPCVQVLAVVVEEEEERSDLRLSLTRNHLVLYLFDL